MPPKPPNKENVATAGGSSSGLPVAYLLAALVGITLLAIQRLPDEVLARSLETARSRVEALRLRVGLGGLVAAAVTALVVLNDYRRSFLETYVPASVRVRAARSIVVGLIGVLSVLLLAAAFAPRTVLGLPALASLPLWIGFAAAYGLACLTPVKRVYPPLVPYREAAEALRNSEHFLLGATGVIDWKRPMDPLRWLVLRLKAMTTNILAIGGIGSGKTETVLKPLLEQALYKFPNSPAERIGLLIIDGTKGSLTEWVHARAKLAGRAADVIEITPGGPWSWNPIADGTPTAQASKLVAALEVMTNQESNSYYKKMQREFAENAFQILGDVLGAGRFTLKDLYTFVCEPAVQAKFLKAAKPTDSISYRWFINQWQREDPREQMMLTKGFRADLSLFVRDELSPTFCVADATFPGWRDFLEKGHIVVFNMDLSRWGELTRALGIFLLMDFQRAMIARSQPSFKAAGGNVQRLVLGAIDECWAFMNPGLPEFTAVSRESRCCTLALTQSLGQIHPSYRDTMLANCRTAIVLPAQDPLTLATYSRLLGAHRAIRRSNSESVGFSGVEQQLLSDVMRAREGGESRSVSLSTQEVDEPRFSETDLLHLEENTAAVLTFNGRVVEPSRAVRLMPAYKPEYQLWPEGEGR